MEGAGHRVSLLRYIKLRLVAAFAVNFTSNECVVIKITQQDASEAQCNFINYSTGCERSSVLLYNLLHRMRVKLSVTL